MEAWHPGRWSVGTMVRWRGVRLVCTLAHMSPPEAINPWDVDRGREQDAAEAALYWSPAGLAEVDNLRVVLVDNRQHWSDYMRACIWHATGGREAA